MSLEMDDTGQVTDENQNDTEGKSKKPFPCPIPECPKGYNKESYLQRHNQDSHMNEWIVEISRTHVLNCIWFFGI